MVFKSLDGFGTDFFCAGASWVTVGLQMPWIWQENEDFSHDFGGFLHGLSGVPGRQDGAADLKDFGASGNHACGKLVMFAGRFFRHKLIFCAEKPEITDTIV